jgi:hypothetical protein
MSKMDLRSPRETEPLADLTTATPAEIDVRLEALQYESARLAQEIVRDAQSIYSYTNTRDPDSKPRFRDTREVVEFDEAKRRAEEAVAVDKANEGKAYEDRAPLPHGVQAYYADYLAKALTDLAEHRAQYAANQAEQAPLKDEYHRRGGWTRAFLVLNSNGHVHSSQHCSTCFEPRWNSSGILVYEGTSYGWLPTLSGHDEAEIVEKAGSDACTVCYPSAPVDVLKRERTIFHGSEIEAKEARDAERARRDAKRTEKEAKRLIDPDTGENLRDPSRYEIASEVTAKSVYVNAAAKIIAVEQGLYRWGDGDVTKEKAYVEAFLRASAAKHGKPESEIVAELAKKVTARVKRDYR